MIAHLADRSRGPVWVRDVAVALTYLGIGSLLLWAVPEVHVSWLSRRPADLFTTASVLVLTTACLGATARRAMPVAGLAPAVAAVLAGPLLLGFTDLATVLVFGDLLYCAVLFTSRRTSRVVAILSGSAVGLIALAVLVTGGGGRLALITLLLMLLLVEVPVLWGLEVRRHRDLAVAEHDRAEQASRMAELDRAAAVAAERARMARDLHDVVAGQLSAIALQSEAALHGGDSDPELLHRVLASVREGSVSALAEMRTMIGLLRDEQGGEPRTAPARLDQLDPLLDTARARGLRVDVADTRPAGSGPAAAVELAAYRIVQEGLTNAAKHAPGSGVRLMLEHERDALVVRLDNDLTGTPAAPPVISGGTGLAGLRERARAVGGRFEAGPAECGWRLRASLPLVADPPAGDVTVP